VEPRILHRQSERAARLPYVDRADAGRVLAEALRGYASEEAKLVLALPRGGVAVAYEMSRALRAPLDVMVVRKIGVPAYPELAMGAVASGGSVVVNHDVVESLRVSPAELERATDLARAELDLRERELRDNRPPPKLRGRTVILVDDGLATGATMRSAVRAAWSHGAARVIVAVPVAPRQAVLELRDEADHVVCPATPEPFLAVGRFYLAFRQVSTRAARSLLEQAWSTGLEPERNGGPEG